MAGLQNAACRNQRREQVAGDRGEGETESGRKESGAGKISPMQKPFAESVVETICRNEKQ